MVHGSPGPMRTTAAPFIEVLRLISLLESFSAYEIERLRRKMLEIHAAVGADVPVVWAAMAPEMALLDRASKHCDELGWPIMPASLPA